MKVGILSLQGSFFDHQKSLDLISLESLLVKTPEDLDKVDGFILPGGESTAMSKISSYNNLYKKLDTKIKQGLPTLSTCAGTIILAKSVIDGDTHIPNIDIEIQRNAYGRQNESFEAELGQKFHSYSQKMLEKNKDIFGDKEIERLKKLLVDEEEKFASQILKKYEELIQALDDEVEDQNELEIKLSEYGLGFSILKDGIVSNSKMELREDKVAVTFMGQADLVGRYKGKGLVIELKTGQESSDDLTEAELYALGAKLLLKEDEVYVFHIYTNKDGGKLKKRKFGESEFDSIINKFEDKAQRIANWNPNDSLSPSFNVGDWCSNCDYQTTCPEYR